LRILRDIVGFIARTFALVAAVFASLLKPRVDICRSARSQVGSLAGSRQVALSLNR